jgi:hypothetical protein
MLIIIEKSEMAYIIKQFKRGWIQDKKYFLLSWKWILAN